jgi:hypothetical protein
MTAKQVQIAIPFVGLIFGGRIFWGKFCERVFLQKQQRNQKKQRKRIASASQRIEIESEMAIG